MATQIQVKVTNNAGGPTPVFHHHASVDAAHEQAESINTWPTNQIRGSYAVVLIDGVEQESREDQRVKDEGRKQAAGFYRAIDQDPNND